MLYYRDGTEIRIGDHVRHSTALAVVEQLIEGEEVADWGIEEPGFMLVCHECGRVLISPGSEDWEDVAFVRRAV